MLEVFDVQYKESIKYGMTYNQFWFDDPQLYYIYEEIYFDKLKEKDVLNWQLGQYIHFAIGSLMSKECKYPNEPMFFARENKKQKDVYDMLEEFSLMADKVNQNFK